MSHFCVGVLYIYILLILFSIFWLLPYDLVLRKIELFVWEWVFKSVSIGYGESGNKEVFQGCLFIGKHVADEK